MIIIVGLGNPGQKFENTPHNLGFAVVDIFKERNDFPDFSLSKKFNVQISEAVFNNEKIILAKPQTFMNLSGVSIKKMTKNYKLETESLIVVHDDIDLALRKIKIAVGRGSAGHKGIESIIKECGTKDFARFRVGVKPNSGEMKNPERFVLRKFDKTEEKTIKEVIERTAEAIEFAITQGVEKTMNEYNK